MSNEVDSVSHSLLSFVNSQEPVLFATSILENIRYGNPEASDADCMDAARRANAHSFIEEFPDKYQTQV